MTGRSGRGRWQRVLDAKRQARIAQGRDPDQGDLFTTPPKPKKTVPSPSAQRASTPRSSEAIGVLTLGEAAARLGVSRRELDKMIDAGTIEALPTGYTRMIPTSEVERLAGPR